MRILFDECVPKPLKRELTGHQVVTVPERGWASKKNGELLRLMTGEFDVFLTVDQNLQYQQNKDKLGVAVLILVTPSNDIDDIRPLMARVLEILPDLEIGTITRLGGSE